MFKQFASLLAALCLCVSLLGAVLPIAGDESDSTHSNPCPVEIITED